MSTVFPLPEIAVVLRSGLTVFLSMSSVSFVPKSDAQTVLSTLTLYHAMPPDFASVLRAEM